MTIYKKICANCKKELPIRFFNLHSRTKDGYTHKCIKCSSKQLINYHYRQDDKYKLRPYDELYIAFWDGDIDLSFFNDEVNEVIEKYANGVDICEIAEKLSRNVVEIAILVMDLALKDKIIPRSTGVYGEVQNEANGSN